MDHRWLHQAMQGMQQSRCNRMHARGACGRTAVMAPLARALSTPAQDCCALMQNERQLAAAQDAAGRLRAELQAATDSDSRRGAEVSAHLDAARRLRSERDGLQRELVATRDTLAQATTEAERMRAGV
jgi:hypothetical protein